MIDYRGLWAVMLNHYPVILTVFGAGGLVSLLCHRHEKHKQTSKNKLEVQHEDF